MKAPLIAVLAILAARSHAISEEIAEMARMLHDTCARETGVGEDSILDARKGVFSDDRRLKCYMKCLLFEMTAMDETGIIDVETTISILPDDMKADLEDTVRKCGTQVGSDICDNAWLTNKCWHENSPEKYYII